MAGCSEIGLLWGRHRAFRALTEAAFNLAHPRELWVDNSRADCCRHTQTINLAKEGRLGVIASVVALGGPFFVWFEPRESYRCDTWSAPGRQCGGLNLYRFCGSGAVVQADKMRISPLCRPGMLALYRGQTFHS